MRESWGELLRDSSSNTIFLTWEWIYTWVEHYIRGDRKLFILAIHEKDELIAIAPWYINRHPFGPFSVRRIELLGSPETSSDYLDIIVKRGREKEVAASLYSYLYNDISSQWDCFCFKDVPSRSLFFLNFIREFKGRGKYIDAQAGEFCPHLNLPSTKEELLTNLSRNRRQQFRRHLNTLHKRGKVVHEVFSNQKGGEVFNHFSDLYRKRWGEDGDELIPFLRTLNLRTETEELVRIDMLSIDGEHIAGIYHLKYNGVLYYYLIAVDKGFDPKISVGNVLLGLCIQDAIENGISRYDFLKGDESYKFHWANGGDRLINVTAYRNKPLPFMMAMMESIKRVGKVILR